MMNRFRQRLVYCLMAAALPFSSPAWAQDSVTNRIDKLEQEIAALKAQLVEQEAQDQRQREADQATAIQEKEERKLAEAKAANVEFGKGGFKVASADGAYSLRIRGYAQADSRSFISDDEDLGVDTFLIRRARPIIEGTSGNFGFRIMPDFGGTSTQLFDAYAEYTPSKHFNLRAGKFKAPVSLDRLRSATDLNFVERSMPTNLAPNRDIGLMAFGEPIPGFTWELGVFNGTEDLGSSTGDLDDKKEFAARVFAHPFGQSDPAFKGLGIGLAGTWGDKEGSLVNRQVGDYRSPAQARAFRYRSTTFADGDHWRIAPQGYFYLGPFGLQAEYTVSSQELNNGGTHARIENSAWEAQVRYVITGQAAGNKGWPVPANPFNPLEGNWGTWEIAAKYGELDIDDAAFPVFADVAAAVRQESNFGLAIHAYLNDNVRFTVDYENTQFDRGAANDADRETEQVILARLDYKF